MKDALINFLMLDARNETPEVMVSLVGLYLLLLAGFIASVISLNVRPYLKFFALVLILGVPLIGMYLYLLGCFIRADYGFLARFGLAGSRK